MLHSTQRVYERMEIERVVTELVRDSVGMREKSGTI